MMLLHKNLFASKWMQALHMAVGESFSADNAFAMLYVMYNPVCRKDINRKRCLAIKMLAEALYPLHKKYSGQNKGFGFYIKSIWVVLKFAFKNRALADCNPTLVMTAVQQPHAALFKDLGRILNQVSDHKQDAKTRWKSATTQIMSKIQVVKAIGRYDGDEAISEQKHLPESPPPTSQSSVSWIQKVLNVWKRSNRVYPSNSDNAQFNDDAPKLFVDAFALNREFVADNIEEDSRLSLLTLMIFPDAEDFGSSRDCRNFKHKFDKNLEAFRRAFQTLFKLSKDLEFADSSQKIASLSRKERIFQRISELIFGENMKLLRNFHWLTDEEATELFRQHNLPELENDDFKAASVDDVLKQLLAADADNSHLESYIDNQANSGKDCSSPSSPSTLMSIASALKASHNTRTSKIASVKSAMQIETANACDAFAKEAESLRRAAAAESKVLALNAQVSDLQDFSSDKDKSRDATTSAELSRARAYNASLAEQVKALEAAMQIETANARDALAKEAESMRRAAAAESKVLALNAQVSDLQAASQAATAARSSKHDTSADFTAMRSELQSAIKRALDAEEELLRLRAEAKAAVAVAAASTAPAADLKGAQEASKSYGDTRNAADDQALAVDAKSEQVALDQRNTLHMAEADPATNAAGHDGVNAEPAGGKASGGGALAAADQFPNSNPSLSHINKFTLPFSQAPSWKQSVVRARKAPSPFKEVS